MNNSIINTQNPVRQYCIVLDFDLTITDIHTSGHIKNDKFYWNSKQNLDSIINQLTKLKNLNFGIYIVTRNIESNVVNYIKLYGFGNLIDRVFGAINEEHMCEDTYQWAIYKLNYLDEISKLESINKSNIYFFDDTKINIDVAISNGYINSNLIQFDYKKNILSSCVLTNELNTLYNKFENKN